MLTGFLFGRHYHSLPWQFGSLEAILVVLHVLNFMWVVKCV